MGMGYSANYADTIEEGFIEEIAPNELGNFKSALEKVDETLESFVENVDFEEFGDEVHQAYDELISKFKDETGLILGVETHNSEEEGSRYDDVNGVFWTVGGVYEHTASGLIYRDKITRAHYVSFG